MNRPIRWPTLALVAALAVPSAAVARAAAPAVAPDAAGAPVGARVPALTLTVEQRDGERWRKRTLDTRKLRRPTAFLFVGTTCPATRAYLDRLRALESELRAKKVELVLLYPNRNDTRAAKLAFHAGERLTSGLVDDQGARAARAFGAQKTSEVVLVSAAGVVVYRGAIDDSRDAAGVKRRHLAEAVAEHLAGRPISVTTSPVFA